MYTPLSESDIESSLLEVTRVFLATDETLLGLEGVGIFQVRENNYLQKEASILYAPFVFYEVSAFATGSWWIATSTVSPADWEEPVALEATGKIPAINVLWAKELYWWIPFDALPASMNIETIFGRLIGSWPELPPSSTGTE